MNRNHPVPYVPTLPPLFEQHLEPAFDMLFLDVHVGYHT